MNEALTQSAADLGYRMPGEFEPVDAVWLSYPHNVETWPGCFDEACAQYDFYMSQVARFADVRLIGRTLHWPTHDSWIRDYGPLFVVDDGGQLACHDFVFNGWGGKYGDVYGDDDVIPQHVASELGIPIWLHEQVLEGGSIEVNGGGTVMTTEQCLLHANRNPQLNRERLEQMLHDALGTTHCIWLPGGIEGDDTDGHIDDVARFVSPTTVLSLPARRRVTRIMRRSKPTGRCCSERRIRMATRWIWSNCRCRPRSRMTTRPTALGRAAERRCRPATRTS
jgi:agmatine deiminase